jgi:hypothetical protein
MIYLCREQLSEQTQEHVISSFRRYVDELSLLGYYAVYSGNSKANKKGFFDFLTLEDGTDRLPPKGCSELQLYTA